MARLNIEDSLYRDNRFTELCIKFGSKRTALGALVEAWSLAQDYVTIDNPKGLILIDDWKKQRIADEIIDVGLAIIDSDMVYILGAEKQFAWLVAAQIKGKKGGISKAKKLLAEASPANPSLAQLSSAYPLTLSLSKESALTPSTELVPPSPKKARRVAPAPTTFVVGKESDFGEAIEGSFWARWDELYDPDYVEREVTKAVVWLNSNPKKAKKTKRGWVAFMAGWLERGWDRSTTRGSSNPSKEKSEDWSSSAERVLGVLSRGSGDERKAILGDELYGLASKVGWHNIGQMPRNDFTAKTLAGKLKAQWENGGAA